VEELDCSERWFSRCRFWRYRYIFRSYLILVVGINWYLCNHDIADAEIVPTETQKGGMSDTSGQPDILIRREFSSELLNNETGLYSLDGNAKHNDIKSRIHNLESELSSTLHSLRSSSDKIAKQMVSVCISNTGSKILH